MLSLLKEVKPCPDGKMIKFLTFDNLFRHYDILAKTRSRTTTAITFSRQNDAGSRANTTQHWENLVFVVLLVWNLKLSIFEWDAKVTHSAVCSPGGVVHFSSERGVLRDHNNFIHPVPAILLSTGIANLK